MATNNKHKNVDVIWMQSSIYTGLKFVVNCLLIAAREESFYLLISSDKAEK